MSELFILCICKTDKHTYQDHFANVLASANRTDVELRLYWVDGASGAPVWVWNALAANAFDDGVAYMYQVYEAAPTWFNAAAAVGNVYTHLLVYNAILMRF